MYWLMFKTYYKTVDLILHWKCWSWPHMIPLIRTSIVWGEWIVRHRPPRTLWGRNHLHSHPDYTLGIITTDRRPHWYPSLTHHNIHNGQRTHNVGPPLTFTLLYGEKKRRDLWILKGMDYASSGVRDLFHAKGFFGTFSMEKRLLEGFFMDKMVLPRTIKSYFKGTSPNNSYFCRLVIITNMSNISHFTTSKL